MRVLIIKISSMGDLAHTLPALTDARKAYPEVKFDWVAEESFAEIPTWHPAVDRVIRIAIRRWRRNFFESFKKNEIRIAIQQLKKQKYDYIIDAQGLAKSALISLIANGVRCGADRKSCRESLASMAYQQKYFIPTDLHTIERWRLLFSQVLNYKYDKTELDYGIQNYPFPAGKYQPPYLIFIHGTSRAEKLWPLEEWIKLAELAKGKFLVYLPWGNPEEKSRAEEIAGQVDICRVLPKINLSELAGVLSTASGIVGVDTGLAHLGAALDVPAVSIYTQTFPERVGTCGRNQLCLTQKKLNATHSEMVNLQTKYCQSITADKVWEFLQVNMNKK